VGYPILDETGTVQAVAYAALDLAWLQHLVTTTQVLEGASLLIIDPVGTIIARAPDHQVPGRLETRKTSLICTIVTWHGEGTAEPTSADGLPRLYAFTPLREGPGDG
jgi:hypothetical protein